MVPSFDPPPKTLADGAVCLSCPLRLQVYPLSRAAEAQTDLAGRKTTGKLLLRPDHLL